MTQMTCPQCGAALSIDLLTREPRPCSTCGTIFSLDSPDRPNPDPDHQQSINRQKYFEIAAVIIMIIVGFGYLAISTGIDQNSASTHQTKAQLSSILTEQGFQSTDSPTIQGQSFQTFTQQGELLRTTVDLISYSDDTQTALGTILIAVSLPEGHPFPPDTIIEPAVQKAFNTVTDLTEALVPHSTPGLEKAVSTTVPMSINSVKHHKGVAQTSSGWKITYINYREYKDGEHEVPLLVFIYQKLSVASNSNFESFHQALYKAVNEGGDIKNILLQQKDSD